MPSETTVQENAEPLQGEEVDSPPLLDLGIGLAFVVLGLVLGLNALEFSPTVPGTVIGPGLMPLICAAVFLFAGAALAIQAFRGVRKGQGSEGIEEHERGSFRFAAAVLGGAVLSILAMPYLGFVVTTSLYAFAVTIAGGAVWWRAALLAVVVTGCVYVLFQMGLRVPLPVASLF